MTIQFEKARFNVFTIGAILVAAVAQAIGIGVTYANLNNRIAEGERYRVSRSTSTDAQFASIKQQLEPIGTDRFRLVQLETVVAKDREATDLRIDRVVDSLSAKVDQLNENVSGLRTEVRVLSQKYDNGKRAALEIIPPEFR